MKLDARLTFNKIRFDQETAAHLVVTVTAPEATSEDKRPPLCIVPLVDVSPSMEGAKLLYAKRSLIKMIDHLSAQDYCGLIAFSGSAETLAKPVKCTVEAKEQLKRKVHGLTLSGSTNIAGALLEGFRVANNMDLPSEVISRVILFTDGAANAGPATQPKDILALVEPNIGLASVSAFGYGDDAVQDFLSDLSKVGNGNYSFIKNPDDALTAFGKELGGLLSTYATSLSIDLNPLAGHGIELVVTDVDADEEDTGQVRLKVADILAGESRDFVLAVKLREQKSAFPRAVNVFDVRLGFDTLDANLRREHNVLETTVKAQFVKNGEQQERPDPELDKIVGLAQVVRAQLEAEEHAKRGDFIQAQSVMSNCSESFTTRGLNQLGAVATGIGGRMGSRNAYIGSSAYLTSVTRGATRGYGGTYDAGAAQDLQSLGVAMSNSSQVAVTSTFEAPDASDAPMSGATNDPHGSLRIDRQQGSTWASQPLDLSWGVSNFIPPVNGVFGNFTVAPPIAADPTPPVVVMDVPKKTKPKPSKRKITQKSKRW
jgi:Ca-activated chloride channel family protein